MQINESVFVQIEFFALILFSLVLPVGIYGYLMWIKALSRIKVLLFGILLIAISGVDIFLLQRLATMSKNSATMLDGRIFSSEISVALYLLPILFAGIGVNIISHVLISHVTDAEKQYDRERQ